MEAQTVLSSSHYITIVENPVLLSLYQIKPSPSCSYTSWHDAWKRGSIQFRPFVYKEWIRYKQLSGSIIFDKLYEDFSCRQGKSPFGKYPGFGIKRFLAIITALLSLAIEHFTTSLSLSLLVGTKKKKANSYLTQRNFFSKKRNYYVTWWSFLNF